MMDGYYGQGGGYDVWGFIFMIFMMVLVVVGVIVLVRYFGQHSSNQQKQGSALDILEKRFANGEIDKKEFEDKRKVLSE
jgi:putative membrane protein